MQKIQEVRQGTIFVIALIIGAFLFFSQTVKAGTISEGFPSDGHYPSGTLVSIQNTVPTTIALTSTVNSDYMVGVVENNGDSLLTFTDDQDSITVATIGEAEAFVSDANGDIKIGDFIGASWIKGVGMKADSDIQQKLLGIAIEDFDSNNTDIYLAKGVETPSGSKNVKIGKILVRLFNKEIGPDTSEGVSSLETFASRLAGKDVSYIRLVAAAGLFVIATFVSAIFLASAIRGSFISIGRNPLSSSSIFNSLMQVSGVAVSLLLIGAVLAYLVLII